MLKIVIIDDNYAFVESLYNELESKNIKNFNVLRIFSNGKNALDYILNENIDVILLDLNMPNINGIELIEQIKNANIKTKIITITGDNTLMLELLQKNLNIYKSFMKPFNIEILIDTLNELINTNSNNVRENIINLLDNFYFNKSNIGYSYLIDCLEICIINNYTAMPSSKIIYTKISNIYKKDNYLKVGWNIDKSIKVMNNLTSTNIKEKFFPYGNIPSTKNFINCILDHLYKNYKF